MIGPWGRRKERRLGALEEYRQVRRLVAEDVTVFGEQLRELRAPLAEGTQHDHQRSLDLYEDAKAALARAEDAAAVRDVEPILDDGRFHLACVLARRDGEPLPSRREPCFFNPQHGPAAADVLWTPPHGAERRIPVCGLDAARIEGGGDPDVRMVRVGDRFVPWYAAQPLSPGGAFSSSAALGGRRAHVAGGRSTAATDAHLAEAHLRSAQVSPNPGGPGI